MYGNSFNYPNFFLQTYQHNFVNNFLLFFLTSTKFCRIFVLDNCQSNAIRGFVFFSTRIGYTPTRPPPTPRFHYKVGRSLLFRFYFKTPPFVKSLSLCILSIHIVPSYFYIKDTIKILHMQIKSVKILHKKRGTICPPSFRLVN